MRKHINDIDNIEELQLELLRASVKKTSAEAELAKAQADKVQAEAASIRWVNAQNYK